MGIINGHVHMIEVEALAARQSGPLFSGEVPVYTHIEQTLPLVLPETLIRQMDEANIEKSILFAVDGPILYSSNEYVRNLCDRFPDRLIGFASVDPKKTNSSDIFEKAVKDLDLKGLKLHPPLQDFYPNDKKIYPLYEKAIDLNVPVVFHVGTTPFGKSCKLSQADPILIDQIANDFPELRILLTHLGTLWHHSAFMVVEKHPNVYIDTAAFLYEIPQLLTIDLVNRIGANKIVFGTDYPSPFCDIVHKMSDFVDCISELDLPSEFIDCILTKNVFDLLHGSSIIPNILTVDHIYTLVSKLKSNSREGNVDKKDIDSASSRTYIDSFDRNIGFLTQAQQKTLRKSKIAVLGLGGLGGTCFEVLLRCGIGSFSIVDKDTFELSNINRQIFSFHSTIGKKKTDVAEKFALDINPDVVISKFHSLSTDNVDDVIQDSSAIVLAIDEIKPCVIISRAACASGVPIIEGWGLPYCNYRVISKKTPTLEDLYDLPFHGRDVDSISDDEFKSASFNYLNSLNEGNLFSQFYTEKIEDIILSGRFPTFAPIVWLTSLFMAMETIKLILGLKDVAMGPSFSLYDPFSRRVPSPNHTPEKK